MGKYLLVFSLICMQNLDFAQQNRRSSLRELLEIQPSPVYEKHLEASRRFNMNILESEKTVSGYRKSGKLVKVKNAAKGYTIEKLDYSRAVLVPRAKDVLRELSKEFFKATKGSTLTITSLTRTLDDQSRLRKVNGNAAHGVSSHNYGNSFDISYVRFNGRLENNPRLEKSLKNTLDLFEKTGKIYFIKEKQQSCYHITVR